MELKINKEFQNLIPPLTDEEYKGLEQSIVSEGCRDAILIWHDTIIDGHNRYNICQDNNIDFKVDVLQFDNNDEAKIWIIHNQFSRRNLRIEDRIELALQLEGFFKNKAQEKKVESGGAVREISPKPPINTREEIAKIAGVSSNSVSKYKKIKEAGKVDEIKKGKSINKVHKEIVREQKKEQRLTEDKIGKEKYNAQLPDNNIQIWHGDFRELCNNIPSESVDAIITDPPYPREYLPLWSDLSKHAERVLKPSGFCVCYSGHLDLPEVLNRLSEHLDYYWTFCLYHKGTSALCHPVNVMCRWKPILIFQKPPRKIIRYTDEDYVVSEKREKDNHIWQQSESGVASLIDRFSKPNDLILDPFIGGGTTAYVARKMSRRCIGIDIDEVAINSTKSRLLGV